MSLPLGSSFKACLYVITTYNLQLDRWPTDDGVLPPTGPTRSRSGLLHTQCHDT